MFLLRNKGKSKVLSGGFCLLDLEVKQRALQFLHVKHSTVLAVTP